MNTLNTLAEVERNYVTATWVAQHYGVSRLTVHRAIAARRLVAARIRGAGRDAVVLDRRLLPLHFPST